MEHAGPGQNWHDDDGRAPNLLAYDHAAALLTLRNDGAILLRDIRKWFLSEEWLKERQNGPSTDAEEESARLLRPQPPVDLRASHLCISCDGSYAALAGTKIEDPDQAAVAAVDLACRRPAARDGTGAERCSFANIEEEYFRSRPGLQVLQMAWHPGSSTHLAVLTSDNTWQLYHVGNLSVAEQRFELRLQRRRGLGVDGSAGRRTVSFAFGPQRSWLRFTVFFLCSDGTVFALCPVAPFGAGVPLSAAQLLAEIAADREDAASSDAMQAWLQQALPGASSARSGTGSSLVTVQRHALDEHVPGLVGPLPVTSAEGPLHSFLDCSPEEDDAAANLCTLSFGGALTVLVASSCEGMLGVHVLADDVTPRWAESAPLCLAEGARLLSVQSEVPAVEDGETPNLLMLDLIDLEVRQEGAVADLVEPASSPQLLPDTAAPERLFVRTATAAWAVNIAWLPALANFLAEDREALEEVPQLPVPAVERLFSTTESSPIVGACPFGDALTGTALAVLTADGRQRCLRPLGCHAPDQGPAGSRPNPAEDSQLDARVKQLYGALLRGPMGHQEEQQQQHLSVSSPEGTKALSEAIHSLLERHVEYIHQAHHHLMPRFKELGQAGEAQQHQLDRLTDLFGAVQQSQQSLESRVEGAAKLHSNLQSRVKLLTELHWQLPRPMTPAEEHLYAVRIPGVEAALEELQHNVQGAKQRWAAVAAKMQFRDANGGSRAAVSSAAVPTAQLTRIRAALAEVAALTVSASQGLSKMEAGIDLCDHLE